MASHHSYSLTSNKIVVSYSNNYAPAYEVDVDSEKNFVLSQSYSLVRDQSSRYNLVGYSMDGGDVIEISRKPRGNFTLDIPIDAPHSIVFFAKTQFPLAVRGISDYQFEPKSPTGDNWFDTDTQVHVNFPSTIQRSDDTREVITSWKVDNNEVHHVSDETSQSVSTQPILMTDFHEVNVASKIQYQVNVLSDYGAPYGSGWYDANSTATVGIQTPHESFEKAFKGWQGATTPTDDNPSTIFVDSPKTLTAKWNDPNFFTIIVMIIGVISSALLIYYKGIKKQVQKNKQIQESVTPQALNNKIITDNTYGLNINKFMQEKTLEMLESYYNDGLIDEDKYLKIKNEFKTNIFEQD